MFSSLALRSLCLVLVVALAGCDLTGDYQLRIDEAATAAPQKAGAGAQGAAGGGTPINGPDGKLLCTIKLPAFFTPAESQWLVPGAKDKNGKDITADRANPPGVPLPGWSACYEVFVDNGAGQKLPVYVYFGSAPGNPEQAAPAQFDQIKNAASALPGMQKQPGFGTGLTIGPTVWVPVLYSAEMPFDGSGNGAGTADVKAPGACQIYVSSEAIDTTKQADHVVIIGWRRPDACEPILKFNDAVKAAMESVVIPAANAAAPAPPMGAGAPSGL